MEYTGYFDGAAEPNPGRMGIGAIVLLDQLEISAVSRLAGQGTNNEAEWLALIALLELVILEKIISIQICGDSQLVIKQVTGQWEVNAEHLRPYRTRAQELTRRIPNVRFKWVRRELNTLADALSTRCLKGGA